MDEKNKFEQSLCLMMIKIAKKCWVPLRLPKEEMSDDDFFAFSSTNKEMCIERNADGQITARPPSDLQSSWQRTHVASALEEWSRLHIGIAFGSSLGYSLPNGSVRAASASWITNEKWRSLSNKDKEKFLPFAPDFVIEVPSFLDTIQEIQTRMKEWMANGSRLGWLIASEEQSVFIYRADGTIGEVKSFDQKLSGEDVLPGFEFDLSVLL